MLRRLIPFLALLLSIGLIALSPGGVEGAQKKVVKYARGYKPEVQVQRTARHVAALARNGDVVAKLPKATAATFDCQVTFGNELPEDDQMQCGDCFGVSSTDGCSMALILAKVLPYDASKGRLSSQWGLDSGAFQGGCNGGDEAQVIDYIATNGFPLTSDYGPYVGGPQQPKSIAGMTLYGKGLKWGYCTPSQQQGVAAVQDIKNCMATYGPISVAFDASECDAYVWPGTMTSPGNNVDHAVLCVGWDDNHDNGDGSKGAFIGKNQWGAGWGQSGTNRFWIKYGSESWGTEAIWMSGGGSTPPAPIPPTPPTPPTPAPIPHCPLWKKVLNRCPTTAPVESCQSVAMMSLTNLPCGPIRHLLGKCEMPMLFPNRPRLFGSRRSSSCP